MLKPYYLSGCAFVNQNFSSLLNSIETSPDKKMDEALDFVNLGPSAREIKLFAYFACFFLYFFSLIASLLALIAGFGFNTVYVLFLGLLSATALFFLILQYPLSLVAFERMNSIGYAPRLIAYLIITLKEDPNLEKAVKFASENGEDHMSQDLRRLLWNTWAGKHNSVGEALPVLGHKWGEHVKGLRDALYAIRSSQVEKYEQRRLNTLDRALKDLLENINAKFREFANSLRLPIMFLFMGGVMMPLMVILFIPVLSMMGFELGTADAVSSILVMILLGVFIMSEYILSKRPVSFSSVAVGRDHPGLTAPGKAKLLGNEISIYKLSLILGMFFALFSVPYLMGVNHPIITQWGTFPLVLGLFAAFWAYFWFDSIERVKIRNMVQRAEDDCIEACFHIGNRLMSGMPPEEALIRVSETISTPTYKSYLGVLLDNTVKNIKYMNMSMKDAFFDSEKGSLRDVHSGLIHGLFGLFSNSMERGVDAAAQTLIHSASHFRDIRKVEESLRETISYTTNMIKLSAVFIAPMLCGLSVTMTEMFIKVLEQTSAKLEASSGDALGTSMIMPPPKMGPDAMTLILGVYSLFLLLVLIRFTTILEIGDDEVTIKHEIGKALPKAIIVFGLTLLFCRVFFANIIPTF
jgi:hypothetical protein